jgi:uncharacterized protein (TIGR03083 family)
MDMWNAIGEERMRLADQLAGLDDEHWNCQSLCEQWRVRDVVAHVTAGAEGVYGIGVTLLGLARNGFSFNRWMSEDGQLRGRQDPTLILKAFRSAAGNRKKPPGAPTVSVLTDVLIHGQDVCRPLGIHRELPAEHVRLVADFVKSTFVFGAKRRTAGVMLSATDMEWTHGVGPEVRGSGEALVMAMAGRRAAFDDLTGDGKETFTSRF